MPYIEEVRQHIEEQNLSSRIEEVREILAVLERDRENFEDHLFGKQIEIHTILFSIIFRDRNEFRELLNILKCKLSEYESQNNAGLVM